jgi:hypothetical protein
MDRRQLGRRMAGFTLAAVLALATVSSAFADGGWERQAPPDPKPTPTAVVDHGPTR